MHLSPAARDVVRRRARVRAGCLAVMSAVALVLAGCADSRPSGVPAPGPSVGRQLDAAVPPGAASTVLVTSTGSRLDLSTLRGKVIVVSDMMTLCQETCPLDTADVVAAARAVEAAGLGSRVEFLSVTIDPQRDTVSRLAAYRKLYQPAPADWAVATSTAAGLSTLWKDFGVYIQKVPDHPPAPRDWLTGAPLTYDLTHSDELLFLDQHTRERFALDGSPHVAPGAPLPAALQRFMDSDGRRNLHDPDPMAWTLPQELQVVSWLLGRHVPGAS